MYLAEQGEKVGVVSVHLYRPFSIKHFVASTPRKTVKHRCARPHKGTWISRRASIPGCGYCVDRRLGWAQRQRLSVVAMAWPLRNLPLQWSKVFLTNWQKPNQKTTSRSASMDDVTNTSLSFDPTFRHRIPKMLSGASFGAWALMAQLERTTIRSTSSGTKLAIMHKAISSTIRRNLALSPSLTYDLAPNRSKHPI